MMLAVPFIGLSKTHIKGGGGGGGFKRTFNGKNTPPNIPTVYSNTFYSNISMLMVLPILVTLLTESEHFLKHTATIVT